ncbi:MAG TPA: hypothetical protein PKA28_16745 [Methylomusa anaerophila]|uniref:Uncharacterized protein n=1 Tax=Methylomusa anaerophila TaxID=1930071 RepID=A0A348AEP2_9FIRM|nr:hypothetical protein [Methylomusa anaerophila]BBB89540.1 hypothetical protein MAMMFC1_00173 [Methylomusa anaerophila]HML90090.1 hypothetical protein [Methylomusa anaerophila]
MTIAKAKAIAKQYSSEEDRRYRQVMAELDDIFEQGRKEAAQSGGISFREYIKAARTRLGARE